MTFLLNDETKLFGVEPKLLQYATRILHDAQILTSEDVRCAFTATSEEGGILVQQLLDGDYIKPWHDETERFEPTSRLAQLCAAKRGKGIPRHEADRLLNRIVASAQAYNATPEAENGRITCVVVFGSYLSDKPVLGDLDIGFEHADPVDMVRIPNGRESLGQYFHRIAAPQDRAQAALRVRKPNQVSVHTLGEVMRLAVPYRVVYGKLPPSTARAGGRSR